MRCDNDDGVIFIACFHVPNVPIVDTTLVLDPNPTLGRKPFASLEYGKQRPLVRQQKDDRLAGTTMGRGKAPSHF